VCQRKVRSLILGDCSKLQNRSRHILATVSLASKGVCGAGHLTHLAQFVQPSLVLILNESSSSFREPTFKLSAPLAKALNRPRNNGARRRGCCDEEVEL